MIFNSFGFIFVFLPSVLAVFFALPEKFASLWLIAASLAFYGSLSLQSLPLLVLSVLVNYALSLKAERSRLFLALGLAFNFSVLAFFKLTGTLPLGISFYTFTQSAYLVDKFRGNAGASSLVEYARHVMFFGCIASGPIARFNDTRPAASFSYDAAAKGVTLFVLGLVKKVCSADTLAKTVNALFTGAQALTFAEGWLAALGYAVQLYYDFSGYSDMAIGVGLMFGMSLPQNFDSPYKSLSIIEFWRRWHMSLGAWVKDYLYIPLGGSRRGEAVRTRNVMLAMLFTGLWHGLGWTFVVWGAAHGVLLAVNHWWRNHGVRLPAVVSWVLTFGSVVMLWVVFRAESLGEAWRVIYAMVDVRNFALPVSLVKYFGFLEGFGISFKLLTAGIKELIPALGVTLLCLLFAPNTCQIIENFRPSGKWAAVVVVLSVWAFVNFSGVTDFLYFQF